MTKSTDNENKEKQTNKLSLKTSTLNKVVDAGQVKQSFSHGRTKSVAVEVKKRRTIQHEQAMGKRTKAGSGLQKPAGLTDAEWEARLRAIQAALKNREEEEKRIQELREQRESETQDRQRMLGEKRQHEEELKASQEERKRQIEQERQAEKDRQAAIREEKKGSKTDVSKGGAKEAAQSPSKNKPKVVETLIEDQAAQEAAAQREETNRKSVKKKSTDSDGVEEEESPEEIEKALLRKKLSLTKGSAESRRRGARITIQDALSTIEETDEGGLERPQRSLAALRRAREKEKMRLKGQTEHKKIVREVIIPETIVVSELANRMAVRVAEVVKCLMRLGVLATANEVIDADTAELVVDDFGHTHKRVAESDVEDVLKGEEDLDTHLQSRAPVVTIMGHVDHGKTSLLDAIRSTDIAGREAGGITQHIGAYQVQIASGGKITFLDTPGHAAFTAMRARGANVTDIVVLVVAADDGIMEQTIEAIHHAKAAEVPIIVAINKMDMPAADPARVRNELLQHGVFVESMGGDVLDVEVSAKKGTNLDKLEEAILLQSEILELKSNINRSAEGAVIESKLDLGRGSVATILIQRGTLKIGDIFVAGAEWGRVRKLINDHGQDITEAGPSVPVEVVGFNGTPEAGDRFNVVDSEGKAREISEFRVRKTKNAELIASRKTMDQMFQQAKSGEQKILAVVIKADVQGSVEAIAASLEKLSNEEVSVKVLHSGVGGINESDIVLARASGGIVIGFNVRANAQARDMAKRDGVEIRYYSIIYNIIDDARAALSGLLSPEMREEFIGTAEIRQVFNITKVGRIAGCMVKEGMVKRGSKVRLLRDNVVIHEGMLKTLKRVKDEAKEVKAGLECGMAFENYQDIRVGDVIECFDVKEIQRSL